SASSGSHAAAVADPVLPEPGLWPGRRSPHRSLMAHISLVIPTRNERENIAPLLNAVRAGLSGRDFEVWIVDDDSPDHTWEVAATYAQSHPEISVLRR